jgi:cytochrome c553
MSDQKHQQAATCAELDALIAQCDTDDPEPALVAQVDEHLATCPICHQAEDDLTRAVAAYRSAALGQVSAEFEESLVERLCRNPE